MCFYSQHSLLDNDNGSQVQLHLALSHHLFRSTEVDSFIQLIWMMLVFHTATVNSKQRQVHHKASHVPKIFAEVVDAFLHALV